MDIREQATSALKIARHLLRDAPKNLDLNEEKRIIEQAKTSAKLRAWEQTKGFAEVAQSKISLKMGLYTRTHNLLNYIMVNIDELGARGIPAQKYQQTCSALYDQLESGRVQEAFENGEALDVMISAIIQIQNDYQSLGSRFIFLQSEDIAVADISADLAQINECLRKGDINGARELYYATVIKIDDNPEAAEQNAPKARAIIAEINQELSQIPKSQTPEDLPTTFSAAVEAFKQKRFTTALESAIKAQDILDGVKEGYSQIMDVIRDTREKVINSRTEEGFEGIDFETLLRTLDSAEKMVEDNNVELARSYATNVIEQLEASKRPLFDEIKAKVENGLKVAKIELYNYDKAGMDIKRPKEIVIEVTQEIKSAEKYSDYIALDEMLAKVDEFIKNTKTEFELASNPPKYISYKLKLARERIAEMERAGLDVSKLSSLLEEHRGVFSRAVSDEEINSLRNKIDPFFETLSQSYDTFIELKKLREDIEEKLDIATEKIDILKEKGYETTRLWADLKNKENICKMSQTTNALKLVQDEVSEWLESIEQISQLNPSVFARQERIRSIHFDNNKLLRTLEKEGEDVSAFEERMEQLQNVDTESMDELGAIIDKGEALQKELEDLNHSILNKKRNKEQAKIDLYEMLDRVDEMEGFADLSLIRPLLEGAQASLESGETNRAIDLVRDSKNEMEKLKEKSSADIGFEMDTEDIDPDVWDQTRVTITNTGMVALKDINISMEGPVEIRRFKPIPELGLNETMEANVAIIFRGKGNIPLDVWISAHRSFDDEKVDIHKDVWVDIKGEETTDSEPPEEKAVPKPGEGDEEEAEFDEEIEWEGEEEGAEDEAEEPPQDEVHEKKKAIELIKELAELKDQGIITEEEFQTKKKQLLDKI